MASIREYKGKHGVKYQVLYFVKTSTGRKQQSAGTFDDYELACNKKDEIELLEKGGKLKITDRITVEDFFNKVSPVLAIERKWTPNYYKDMKGHMRRHVFPEIGNQKVIDIKSTDIKLLFVTLMKKKVNSPKYQKVPMEERPYLSSSMIQTLYTHVMVLFEAAVEWEIIEKSPVTMKKPSNDGEKEENIWDDETTVAALNSIESPLLHLAVHVGLFTTSRAGEIVGLTRDKLFLDDLKIRVNATLQRISKADLEELRPKDIVYVFPEKVADSTSVLVLKATKTKNSKTVEISPELRKEIRYRLQEIEKHKLIFGDEYHDHNLLFCHPDGSPIEPGLMSKWFLKWQKRIGSELGIPRIEFHKLRHIGTTMYMEITKNNVKQVQGITGHASQQQIMSRYYHVRDPKRTASAKMAERLKIENASSIRENEVITKLLKAIENDPELQKKLSVALRDK